MTEQDNAGLWRYWCEQASKLAETNVALREELREARGLLLDVMETLDLRLEEAVSYDECRTEINKARAFLAKTQLKGTAE